MIILSHRSAGLATAKQQNISYLRWGGYPILFLVLVFYSISVQAITDSYSFSSPDKQSRFQHLTNELRCLVCQNQSLAESNAPLAEDLRQEVANLLNQDKTDQEITAYLVQRYGNFVLFRPPLLRSTMVLWSAPFIVLLIAASLLGRFILKQKPVSVVSSEVP